MSIGYWINAKALEITQIEIDERNSLRDLQKAVGGPIEIAHEFPKGDVCFVDEEGLFKGYTYGFQIVGSHQEFFVGNGVVVGREYPNSSKTRPPSITLEELKSVVRFAALLHRADTSK